MRLFKDRRAFGVLARAFAKRGVGSATLMEGKKGACHRARVVGRSVGRSVVKGWARGMWFGCEADEKQMTGQPRVQVRGRESGGRTLVDTSSVVLPQVVH